MITIEEAKQELREYVYNKKWIEEKLIDIKERRTLLDNITSTISDMPRGTAKVVDKKAEELSKIMDDTNELQKYIDNINDILKKVVEQEEKQKEILNQLNKVEQPYKNILYFRYIRGYNLTEVSNEIEEEYDYTRKLHGIALVKYSKVG